MSAIVAIPYFLTNPLVIYGSFCQYTSIYERTQGFSYFHRLFSTKQLVMGLQGDGSSNREADEARTRDSLLGRQEPTKTPLDWYASASKANLHALKDI